MSAVLLALLVFLAPDARQQPDPAAIYERGQTWESFLDGVRSQRDRWQTIAAGAVPAPALVERTRAAAEGLKLLVVSEAACSDSVQSVPYIARLAALAGVDLRIVGKNAATALLEGHRTPDGRTATPTVILLRDGKDVGAWIERPAALQAWFLAHGDLTTQERLARKTSWYDWDRGESTLAELVALIEKP